MRPSYTREGQSGTRPAVIPSCHAARVVRVRSIDCRSNAERESMEVGRYRSGQPRESSVQRLKSYTKPTVPLLNFDSACDRRCAGGAGVCCSMQPRAESHRSGECEASGAFRVVRAPTRQPVMQWQQRNSSPAAFPNLFSFILVWHHENVVKNKRRTGRSPVETPSCFLPHGHSLGRPQMLSAAVPNDVKAAAVRMARIQHMQSQGEASTG